MARREIFLLVLLWLAVSAANLFKPYTVDDGAHLLIAQWILAHPLHPMRGLLNWVGSPEPISNLNQPALYFYLLAGWGGLFGFSEPAMHALQALFSAGCIWLFHRLARRLAPRNALWLTAMLVLNPAFVTEQNLMVDVPLLGCWLAFFERLLAPNSRRPNLRFGLAGLACAAALLIKYSSLVLPPILLIALLRERRWRQLWSLGLPAAALLGWAGFNLADFGGLHMLTAWHASLATYKPRPGKSFELMRRLAKALIAWAVAAGALSPFGVLWLSTRLPRLGAALLWGCFGLMAALAASVAARLLPDSWADHALWLIFVLNGALLAGLLWPIRRDNLLLILWVTLTSLFYMLLAPFIAARHVLLILPALALLAAMRAPPSRQAKFFGLAATAVLAAGLSLSDFRAAEFYKTEAAAIPATLPPGSRIVTAGHWGWQVYAAQAGMPELDISAPPPPGTCLVVPREVDHQLPRTIHMLAIRTVNANFSPGDPFCTGRPSRFYLSYVFRGPWSLSADCSQHIDIFEIMPGK